MYILFLIILFNFTSRQTAFYFSFVFSVNMVLSTFNKFALEDGRPFMYTSRIFPYVCELEFGNPSDETMNFTTIIFAAALHYYDSLKKQ